MSDVITKDLTPFAEIENTKLKWCAYNSSGIFF